MADKNVPSAESKNSKLKVVESKQKKEKKEKMSFKKLMTIIIIAVLALLMVGGLYYVIVLVNQSKAEKANAWGTYDGESILIENNNVFYNTLVNDSNLQTAYLNGDYSSLYSSYYNAYQAQVAYMALTKDAKEAGITAPQDLVNDLIIRSGVYSDEDGNFSADLFNASSESSRITVNTYYTNYYPYTAVLSDLQSTILSKQELEFVEGISKVTRSFDYFVINYQAYPDDLAVAYGKEHEDLFLNADVSVISTTSEESANAAYEALKAGTEWTEVVSTYSEDSYASNGGAVGELAAFAIMPNMANAEDIAQLTSLKAGEYTAPIASASGYSIYKLNSDIKAADFTDEATLSAVKYYINQNNPDEVTPYVDAAVGTASALAQTDFEGAAESVNSDIINVSPVNDNVAGSQYLGTVSSYDSLGYLAEQTQDATVTRELFTAEKGYVTGALHSTEDSGAYIVVRVTDINDDNVTNSYVTTMLYNYYAPQQPAYDRINNALNSSLHENNFYTQFFTTLFSSST
ncbi:MAG: peptidylprolyl isomerase [bacterium]|nr:peptidylprolyl isomerase [bacterium]